MQLGRKKLSLKNAFLILLLSGCAGAPKMNPVVIDTDLKEGRVYSVDEKLILNGPIKIIPLEKMNGYFCLSQEQTAKLRAYYLQKRSSFNACQNNSAFDSAY